ncbi:alpha-hydroxy acid oxidase [Roseomonas haemaphysalidis]|uniref:Alpha-hydroxy-acid oxidizing protein n=1 Tax=Roseomonas haemaphysalidis TaxID=2768162 RepID=A0ABS3KUY4_9PROT|nr:alpha-hydroxy acid oxidase [Roseomonas haemaphysalidis]MBO1081298.1 alpha-hydroxy-acid oxidizing protein [Roseomonas haemaphysalidis]
MTADSTTLPRRMRGILSLEDLEPAARRFLPRPVFAYVSGGAESNWSLRDNRAAFAEYGLRPATLIDVSARSLATPLLGQDYATPFGIAPMGFSALAAYRGDLVLAQGAAAAGIPMMLSGASLIAMEAVIRANPRAWFQAYLLGDMARMEGLVNRAAAAGFGTLAVTVDVPVLANRENNVRAGFSAPLRPSARLAWDGMMRPAWTLGTFLRTLRRHGMPHFENAGPARGAPLLSRTEPRDLAQRDHLDWRRLERVRQLWRGPLVIKGILTAEDARRARDSGADAVVVSNHGGRQLDGAISPLRALPEVVEAAGPLPVILDSGIRRGTDVLKALALGASFVFVGRPFLYAAALGGEAGLRHAISLLAEEVSRDMALLGVTATGQLGPHHLLRLRGH